MEKPAAICALPERNATGFETEYPKIAAEPPKKYDGSQRGKEHCSYIMESLETGRKYRGHFNIMNEGCITNLPYECVLKFPAMGRQRNLRSQAGDLP